MQTEFFQPSFVTAIIVALYCVVVPVSMILPKKKKKLKDQIQLEPITSEFRQNRKDFLYVGIPIGTIIGIFGHLEDIIPSSLFTEESYQIMLFIVKLIAIFPVAIFVSLLIVFTGMIIIKYVFNKNFRIPKKEMTEGIFASIALIEIALFLIGNYDIFYG